MKKNTNKKIAFVGSNPFSTIRFRGTIISKLIEFGYEVFVFTFTMSENEKNIIKKLGAQPVKIPISRFGLNPIKDFIDIFRLALKFKIYNIDTIICSFIKPVIYGTIAGKLAGVSKRFCLIEGAGTVFVNHKHLPNNLKRKIFRRFIKFLYQFAFFFVSKVFFVNRDDKLFFIKSMKLKVDKTYVIPGIGIDLNEFQYVPVNINKDKPIRFLMIGWLLGRKGIREYAAAAKIVKQKYPDAIFTLIGGVVNESPDSIPESEILEFVNKGLISWDGMVKDVKKWIIQSHVFVLPSYQEGLSRATMEAMAVGRAVVTTNATGCKDTVINYETGIIVPVADVSALAKAFITLIENKEMIVSMGKLGRQFAEKSFNVNDINNILLKEMNLFDISK